LLKIQQRKQRDFDLIDDAGEVIDILKDEFANRKLYIRYAVQKTEVVINEYLPDQTLMVVTDPTFRPEGDISIYGLSDKYFEVDLQVVEERGPGYYHCKILCGRRAQKGRRDLRFRVTPDEVVATNFRISKHTIDVTGFNVPTSIKVILDQFQSANSSMSDIVKVDILSVESKGLILNQVRKTGKTLLISDVSDRESYRAMNDDFIDLYTILGTELDDFIKRNVEKGYKSNIIVPILYLTEKEESIPFAYIQVVSKTENLGLEKVLELKEHSFKLVDRIRDANTILIQQHQDIIDLSRGGAKLKITDENIKKHILKARGFIFDIVFKMQAPLTIYGEIKATFVDEDNELYVGVDFAGNSSRKDEMKRFYDVLKPMETDYKTRLIKTLKQQKK